MRAFAGFVGYTCQLCPSYGCWHHVRGLVSSIGHFGGSLGRRQFDCGPGFSLCACDFIRPSLVVAASLETVGGAHPFAVPNRSLSRRVRTFASTQVATFVTECRQGHVREHTARIR